MMAFPEEIRKSFIFSLSETYCFRLGTAKCRFLKKLEKERDFNKEEINEVLKAIDENNQLYEAREVKPYKRKLVEKYENKIESPLKGYV